MHFQNDFCCTRTIMEVISFIYIYAVKSINIILILYSVLFSYFFAWTVPDLHTSSLQQSFLIFFFHSLLKKWADMSWSHSTQRPGFLWKTCASFVATHSMKESLRLLFSLILTKLKFRAPMSFFWLVWQVGPPLSFYHLSKSNVTKFSQNFSIMFKALKLLVEKNEQ